MGFMMENVKNGGITLQKEHPLISQQILLFNAKFPQYSAIEGG
jgi:hypothetical protein